MKEFQIKMKYKQHAILYIPKGIDNELISEFIYKATGIESNITADTAKQILCDNSALPISDKYVIYYDTYRKGIVIIVGKEEVCEC